MLATPARIFRGYEQIEILSKIEDARVYSDHVLFALKLTGSMKPSSPV